MPSRVCSRRRSHVHRVPSLHRYKQNATKVAHRSRLFDQVCAWGGGGKAGWGVGGEGAACPLPPKHTPDQIAGCDVQLLWHFVCICGAMVLCVHGSVCGYKHDWAPAASKQIPWQWVSCAEQRWWTFVNMVALKKMVCKDSGPVGSGWLGHREGGEFGRFSRGAWEINRAAFKLAWPGLAWLGCSGGGGLGGRGRLAPSPPSTHLIK